MSATLLDRRTYLAVPYEQKDQVKALGAKYDRDRKAWFVPSHMDPSPFATWAPHPNAVRISGDPRQEFAAALHDAGFKLGPSDPIMDGRVHHRPVIHGTGKPGSYLAYADGVPNGWLQNFKVHDRPQKWVFQNGRPLTSAERLTMRALSAQHEADGAEAMRLRHDVAALRFRTIWDAAIAADGHPYLAAKGIADAPGLRVAGSGAVLGGLNIEGRLLIPLSVGNDLRSLQIIDDTGRKMFAADGQVAGSSFVIGDLDAPGPLVFAEGYATGRAIHDALGYPTVVAFSAYNLAPVAEAYRQQYRDRSFIIAADNDHQKARESDASGRLKPNTGVERAQAAAQSSRALVLVPPFDQADPGTDWDDWMRQHGRDGLKAELIRQIASETRRALAQEIADSRELDLAPGYELGLGR